MEELLKHLGEEVTVSVADNAKGAKGKLVSVDEVGVVVRIDVGTPVSQYEASKLYPWDNIISVTFDEVSGNP
jgi:hypothetical protein